MLDYCIKDIFSLESRLKFDAILQHQVNLADRFDDRPFVLIICALDTYSKCSNEESDIAMREFGEYLLNNTRKSDVCCKLSHNKFIILAPHTSEAEGVDFANKLHFNLEPHEFEQSKSISCSMAVAEYNDLNEPKEVFITRVNTLLNSVVDSGMIVQAN
jgi:GGDEF domain-containing protein